MPTKIYPVILCGGSGTRLWPVSREDLPKQFVNFFSDKSLLQETLELTSDRENYAPPIIISNQRFEHLLKSQIQAIGLDYTAIILEPEAKNTAPAIALAALSLIENNSDACMFVMPSDHKIMQEELFNQTVFEAAKYAQKGKLVTMGIEPHSPHTGYGYIECGEQCSETDHGFVVKSFKEKPNLETATQFLKTNQYVWNSGMFMFTPNSYINNLTLYQPEIIENSRLAMQNAQQNDLVIHPEQDSFSQCTSISIDYAVMEKTSDAVVVKATFDWSDVGEWTAISDLSIANADEEGNVKNENVFIENTKNTYVHSNGRLIAVIGLEESIVVDTKDALLVAAKSQAQRVKNIAEQLKSLDRVELKKPAVVNRPWGSYESVDQGEKHQVKHIVVNPGQKLSLQYHHHRSEHWTVVSGIALVTINGEEKILKENESVFIPQGVSHRLENKGTEALHLIEVQYGSYLGEDDIVRLEDVYGRVTK
ncbi:MAG TPA: mannose-1-phosphate guanylyltransferase/mannose-6-phosphate isomerase [Oligoflexia bacterium]|nr:mannose-1-phosphate guanylyltransferase/mannose-6-phosphate isomerase [Oligoflexia bacterium]HMR24445.1 mannose-1-phosphate guanylyltransferase/mannose-6-phosphate isomerase [Oligoflexia bacterium]